MLANLKLYAGIALTAILGALLAIVRIKSSQLEKAKADLARERLYKQIAQDAAETINQSKEVLEHAVRAAEGARSMSDADARAELRKYARD